LIEATKQAYWFLSKCE